MAITIEYFEATSAAALKVLVDAALEEPGTVLAGGVTVYATKTSAYDAGEGVEYADVIHYLQAVQTTV